MPRLTRSFSPQIPPALPNPPDRNPTLKPLFSALLVVQACLSVWKIVLVLPGPRTVPPPVVAADCDATLDERQLLRRGWTKVFDEEFTGDLGQWNVWNSGAYNEELQLYQPANLRLDGGVLAIETRREAVSGATRPNNAAPKAFGFTSGRIESKIPFAPTPTAPRLRISARLKGPQGYGLWPAFWLCGDAWPTNGEIDILEMRGHEPYTFTTNYAYGSEPGLNATPDATTHIRSRRSLSECWHVYELIWQEKKLIFLLDGKIVDVKREGRVRDLFGKPQRIVLNLAVGGTFFGHPPADRIQPGTFRADWVRVYTAP